MALVQAVEIMQPTLLPTLLRICGLQGVATLAKRLQSLHHTNMALSPLPATVFVSSAFKMCEHGDKVVDKMMAEQAEQHGAGSGELYAAQQNIEFIPK